MSQVLVQKDWEKTFLDYFSNGEYHQDDASHDVSHFIRVANTAKKIASYEENVDLDVVLAASYFHDIITLPKNHPECHLSSRYSAVKAKEILFQLEFPDEKIDEVQHAIESHSFSAKINPETIEARIVQDADRMESLGTLGIMRTFYVSGRLQRYPFDANDLFAKNRPLDDKMFGLDHFYCKLFKLPSLLNTHGGKQISIKRTLFLEYFVSELEKDVNNGSGGALDLTWICYHAGQKGLKLFDNQDPFASNRQLSNHVIDSIILNKTKYSEFSRNFLEQFNLELLGD